MAPRIPSFTLWPGGLVGRVILVLLAALALEFAGSTLLYEQTAALLPSIASLDGLGQRLLRVERGLSALPPDARSVLAEALSGEGLGLAWSGIPAPPDGPGARTPLPLSLLHGQLTRLHPDLALRDLQLEAGSRMVAGLSQNVSGTLRLDDGSTLHFTAERLVDFPDSLYDTLLSTALFAGGILLAAAMVVHTLAAPLRRLARVAGTIGQGPPVHVAEKRGPREVRQVARALNAMQARIVAMVDGRTEALAAVSHDLRTPIARMRLRLGLLDHAEAVQALEGDLAEMEQMISAVLAFLNGETDPEARRTVDVSSILHTLVDDAVDAGGQASFAGPDKCRVTARPLEIKRALGNLVHNAVKYGGCAQVSLVRGQGLDGRAAILIRVEDDGAGIPEAELERVFEPFRRVDGSRNAGLGGIGLGLSIVRRAVERDGGRVRLRNRAQGGLCAEVLLPVD